MPDPFGPRIMRNEEVLVHGEANGPKTEECGMSDFAGQVAIVTGSGCGIDRATASAGRFERYGVCVNQGIVDSGLTAELIAAQVDAGRDMTCAEIIPDAAYDMMRFNSDLARDWQDAIVPDEKH